MKSNGSEDVVKGVEDEGGRKPYTTPGMKKYPPIKLATGYTYYYYTYSYYYSS